MTKRRKKIIFWSTFLFISVVLYNAYKYIPYRFEHLSGIKKVHAHRVNTITKLNQAKLYYTGIELDVIFDTKTNTFDVYHPPAESIGLNLETYLSKLSDDNLKVWLDFKNLTAENKVLATNRLVFLMTKFKLTKQMFLVESKNIDQLQYINDRGFLTSYYVPSSLYNSNKKFKDSIYKLIMTYNQQSISFTHQNYIELHKKFPRREKFVWALYGNPLGKSRVHQIRITRRILKDTTVKRLLVPFKSIGGNR